MFLRKNIVKHSIYKPVENEFILKKHYF